MSILSPHTSHHYTIHLSPLKSPQKRSFRPFLTTVHNFVVHKVVNLIFLYTYFDIKHQKTGDSIDGIVRF